MTVAQSKTHRFIFNIMEMFYMLCIYSHLVNLGKSREHK